MADFSAADWAVFKQQFMSVIHWIMYSFKLVFDSCRAHPMLYAFVFFPVFAGTLIILIDLMLKIVPLKPLFEASDMKSDNSMLKVPKSYNNRLPNGKSINLATVREQSRGAVHDNPLGSARSVGMFGSIKDTGVKGASPSINLGSSHSAGMFGSIKDTGIKGTSSNVNHGSASGSSPAVNLGRSSSTGLSLGTGSGFGTSMGSFAGDKAGEVARYLINKPENDRIEANKKLQQADADYQKEFDRRQKHEEQLKREQAAEDKAFWYQTDIYYSDDEYGNQVTTREVTNMRTGEKVSSTDTVRHKNE